MDWLDRSALKASGSASIVSVSFSVAACLGAVHHAQLRLKLGDDLGVYGTLGLSHGGCECRLGLCCLCGSILGPAGGGIGLGLSRGGGRFGLGLSGGGVRNASVRNAAFVIVAT